MTQALWYVRRNGEDSGPFPAQQLQQMFSLGQLDLRDEISLDGKQWLSVIESAVLDSDHARPPAAAPVDDDWRREREKAKLRWLNDSMEARGEQTPLPRIPDDVDNRLRRHEEETRVRMSAETRRRPAFVAGIISMLLLILVGVGVWIGQSQESGIQTSLASKVSNCALPPAEGVNWTGCVRPDAVLASVVLKNAKLAKARLERADLTNADLSYADLSGANLRGANLRGAQLRGATLTQADLTGVDLAAADLGFAALNGALLDGARLDGARLGQTTWVDGRVCAANSVGTCQ
jgi:hypothetical protein